MWTADPSQQFQVNLLFTGKRQGKVFLQFFFLHSYICLFRCGRVLSWCLMKSLVESTSVLTSSSIFTSSWGRSVLVQWPSPPAFQRWGISAPVTPNVSACLSEMRTIGSGSLIVQPAFQRWEISVPVQWLSPPACQRWGISVTLHWLPPPSFQRWGISIPVSVADPDPPDPRVYGPPGSASGSISQRYGSGSGSGSFHHQANKSKKNLDSYCFVTSFSLFIFEMMYMYLQKVISKSFLLASWEGQWRK